MQISQTKLWCNAKDYFFIVFGIFVYGFGFSAFIAPEGVVIGGMAGFGQDIFYLTQRLFGWGIPVAITMYVTNFTLLAIAYPIVGRQFVIRTIFGATVISLAIGILQPLFPVGLLHGQKFLSILIGSILCGIGVGLAFIHNGSSAGTDIVAMMVSKKSNVSIGRTMQFVDFSIVAAILVINPNATIENVAFGIVNIFIVAFVCDQIINTNRQAVQFMIFSRYWQEIATAVTNEAHRGCTVLDGMGWYTKKDMKILLVMCRKIESVTIFRIIKSIDRDALVTQSKVNGVYGHGFDEMKIKIKPVEHHETESIAEPVSESVPESANA